eukprot:TRINITY_DN20998_c0_g1_i1.p1 TRINITY_DN20998_c0_g1~~TRINITY_DN20998_c0_g1_i1.p1  ORF type:complete len:1008 (+),score=261.18 TRINITY_DN20998_c0_g1_i1:52-3024(+)
MGAPTLQVHPALGAFRHPHMVFIRVVSKWTQRGQRKHRILLLTTKSIYLMHPETHTSRWLRFAEVSEALILPNGEGDIVLLRNIPPEHDLMFQLIDHHHNIPLHTTSADLAYILNRSGVKIVPWNGTTTELQNQARLMKHKGYIKPLDKLRALQKSPITSLPASPPHRFASASIPPPIDTRRESVTRYSDYGPSPRRGSKEGSPVHEVIEKQEEEINALKSEVNDLKQESSRRESLQREMEKIKKQNLDLAKTVLASASNALSGLDTPVVPALPLPKTEGTQRQPSQPPKALSSPEPPSPRGPGLIVKAAIFCVSHGGELQGNVTALRTTEALMQSLTSNIRIFSDAPNSSDKPPTLHNLTTTFPWLTDLRQGETAILTLLCPSKNDGWQGSDGRLITTAEIQANLVAKVPRGSRLVILLGTLPASPGPQLTYGLVLNPDKTLSAMTLTGSNGNEALVQGEVVALGGLYDMPMRASTGQLAGALVQAYTKVLSMCPIPFKELLGAVYTTLNERGPAPTVIVTSNKQFDLNQDFHLALPGIYPTRTAPSPSSPPVSPSPPSPQSRTTTMHSALPQLPVPLMAPFVVVYPNGTAEPPPVQTQDPEYWRNMVCHAFLVPSAFNAPHVMVSSSKSGKQLRLNKDYVSAFVQQWSQRHNIVITAVLQGVQGQRDLARRFQASEQLWSFFKLKIHELLGQRAVQRLMYPHSKDAKRVDNFRITVEGLVMPEEPISCNEEDWLQAVLSWEVENGFSFTKTTLPVPLMPPFDLDMVGEGVPHDNKIAEYLQAELSTKGDSAAKSVSFQYDTDLIRNLAYHVRLMPTARQPPYFVVEDSQVSHPVMVNQGFLTRYVRAWGKINPHLIWVHNAATCTLIAKCRATSEFWKFCCTRGPALMASMGDGNVLTTKDSTGKATCRLAMHMLTITSSSTPETLQLWDGVWCTIVSEWQANLPKADPQWSPTKQLSYPQPGPYSPVPPPPFTPPTVARTDRVGYSL